ncbi:serine/threonine-protein kinase [Nocardia sp. NPDC058658]|uniref:serine/threonine-protein kinase n=1 Tax=Nocardia sp. NPDC058658 TaxID=3346580 RepID=UPI0036629298
MGTKPGAVHEIFDAGTEFWLRMPKAEGSLNAHLLARGKLDESEVIEALTDVATALVDLGSIVVHRDIKPQNILRYQGAWCLADFGIARYTDDDTQTYTYKHAGSRPWQAPERWVGERATIKSDVYSLGVVAFQLVTGNLPFEGPDLYEQHRNTAPPPPDCSPLLSSLIVRMLAKAPEARPAPAKILDELAAASRVVASPAMAKILALSNSEVLKQSQVDAAAAAARTKQERRRQLAQSALLIAHEWINPIHEALDTLPGVEKESTGGKMTYQLGSGRLVLQSPTEASHQYDLMPFDVVCAGTISVEITGRGFRQGWRGREHSLWFCDAQVEGEYHWFETAFYRIGAGTVVEPYAIPPSERDAGLALARGMHIEQVAWPPAGMSGEGGEQFVERWLGWFADAGQGTLTRPMTLPEGNGVWRN